MTGAPERAAGADGLDVGPVRPPQPVPEAKVSTAAAASADTRKVLLRSVIHPPIRRTLPRPSPMTGAALPTPAIENQLGHPSPLTLVARLRVDLVEGVRIVVWLWRRAPAQFRD